jgi:hypothetical protein
MTTPNNKSWDNDEYVYYQFPGNITDAAGFQEDLAKYVMGKRIDISSVIEQERKDERQRVLESVINAVDGMVQKQKPTHGQCCMCTKCGHYNDECNCERNELLDDVIDKLNQLKEEEL